MKGSKRCDKTSKFPGQFSILSRNAWEMANCSGARTPVFNYVPRSAREDLSHSRGLLRRQSKVMNVRAGRGTGTGRCVRLVSVLISIWNRMQQRRLSDTAASGWRDLVIRQAYLHRLHRIEIR